MADEFARQPEVRAYDGLFLLAVCLARLLMHRAEVPACLTTATRVRNHIIPLYPPVDAAMSPRWHATRA